MPSSDTEQLTPPHIAPATKPSPAPAAKAPPSRDFLLHLEKYLARRDGVDKLLKICRYSAKLALTSKTLTLVAPSLHPRLRSFDSSLGLSRKAFRLGKFIQDVNALRSLPPSSSPSYILSFLAYAGEGTYYFLEQLVWLVKAGLLPKDHLRQLQHLSAWAELLGYVGSVASKIAEERDLRERAVGDGEENRKLREKLLMKRLSILQDLADAAMALADVRDGKGRFTGPRLMASAGLLSAFISAHKNWRSC